MRKLFILLFVTSCAPSINSTNQLDLYSIQSSDTSISIPSTYPSTPTSHLYVTPTSQLLPIDYCKNSDATSGSHHDTYRYTWSYTSGFPAPSHLPSSTEDVNVLIIPISTSDSPFTDQDLYFVNTGMTAASSYFTEMSYGRYTLNYAVAPSDYWITLPGTLISEGLYTPSDPNSLGSDSVPHKDLSLFISAQLYNLPSSLDLTSYDIVGLVTSNHPHFYAGHNYAPPEGIPSKSGLVKSAFFKGGSSILNPFVWSHEIAHAWLGLEDLYDLTDFTNTYLGQWDPMEYAGYTSELNAWMRWRSSWIFDSQVRCANPLSHSYHYLYPVHDTRLNNKLIIIPLNQYSVIVLEGRKKSKYTSFDSTVVYIIDTNYNSGHGPFRIIGLLNQSNPLLTYQDYTFNLLRSYSDGDYISIFYS